jgi:hypothetical protein
VCGTLPYIHDHERRKNMPGGTWHDNEMKTELTLWQGFRESGGTRLQVHLFTDPAPALGDDFDCTTLTEPTFPGYAAIFINVWGDPTEDEPSGLWKCTSEIVKFCRTSTGACETVYGYYLTREEDGLCAGMELAWPSGIQFCSACDCEALQITKTEADVNP